MVFMSSTKYLEIYLASTRLVTCTDRDDLAISADRQIHPILVIESSDTRRTSSSLLDAWYGWFMCAAAAAFLSCSCLHIWRRKKPLATVDSLGQYVYVSKTREFQETFSGCQHRQPAAASALLLDAGSWRTNTAPSLCRCALLVSLAEELQGCSCIYAGLVGHDSWRWHHLIFFFFILSLCN